VARKRYAPNCTGPSRRHLLVRSTRPLLYWPTQIRHHACGIHRQVYTASSSECMVEDSASLWKWPQQHSPPLYDALKDLMLKGYQLASERKTFEFVQVAPRGSPPSRRRIDDPFMMRPLGKTEPATQRADSQARPAGFAMHQRQQGARSMTPWPSVSTKTPNGQASSARWRTQSSGPHATCPSLTGRPNGGFSCQNSAAKTMSVHLRGFLFNNSDRYVPSQG